MLVQGTSEPFLKTGESKMQHTQLNGLYATIMLPIPPLSKNALYFFKYNFHS